jgi:hypothetical protein
MTHSLLGGTGPPPQSKDDWGVHFCRAVYPCHAVGTGTGIAWHQVQALMPLKKHTPHGVCQRE